MTSPIPPLKALIDDNLALDGMVWNDKPSHRAAPTPPHVDALRAYRGPPNGCSIRTALDSMSRDNGCLHYPCGSCRLPCHPIYPISEAEPDPVREAPIGVEPGDPVAHSTLTTHWTKSKSEHWPCRRGDRLLSRQRQAGPHRTSTFAHEDGGVVV